MGQAEEEVGVGGLPQAEDKAEREVACLVRNTDEVGQVAEDREFWVF